MADKQTMVGPPQHAPLGIVLAQIGKQVERAFDNALVAAGGDRPTWLALLGVKTGAGRTQRALAERIGISGPTLIHHLDRLEAAGLVTRTRDAGNRRAQVVELTPSGDEVFDRLRNAAVEFDRRLRSGIADDDIAALVRLLEQIGASVAGANSSHAQGQSIARQ